MPTDTPPFLPILSIQFKFNKSTYPIISDTQLQLIPKQNSSYFHVDWTSFSAKNSTIQLYTAAGNFIRILQNKDIHQTTNQLSLVPNNIELAPGIYYAYAHCSEGLNTQNGYAKFVVK